MQAAPPQEGNKMKLVDMTVKEFTDVLASDAPAPGGGSAAALNGALGAALTAMVSSLTIGRKKYADAEELAKETQAKAADLKDKLIVAIDEDTEAFNVMSAAFGMPKETDEEKAARSAAIQEGLVACIESPLKIMELSADALRLTASVVGKLNASAASDLGVSTLQLRSAILGAWLNVLINLSSMKDEAKAADYRAKGQAMVDELVPLADKAFKEVEAMC